MGVGGGGLRDPARAGRSLGGRSAAGEETLDGAHHSVEGGSGVALAEVGGGEAAYEAVDAEAAHGLVAQAEAGPGVASHNEAPALDNVVATVDGFDGVDAGPEGSAGAAAEDAEVVGVLEILSEYDVAIVEERGELRDGEVPDAPWILEVVGYTGVEDEAPPRVGGFVDRSEGLDEEREGQLRGTSSTMPCHVQVANLGPRAILAASLRSQLAWLGLRD